MIKLYPSIFFRRFLRESLRIANTEDLSRMTACALILLGHVLMSTQQADVSSTTFLNIDCSLFSRPVTGPHQKDLSPTSPDALEKAGICQEIRTIISISRETKVGVSEVKTHKKEGE